MTEQTAFVSVLVLCVIVLILLLSSRLTKLEQRIAKLTSMDARLDLLLRHSGIEYDPYKTLPPAVAEAVKNGEKIEAIKRYREATAVGLKEAKDFIEEVQRRGAVG